MVIMIIISFELNYAAHQEIKTHRKNIASKIVNTNLQYNNNNNNYQLNKSAVYIVFHV